MTTENIALLDHTTITETQRLNIATRLIDSIRQNETLTNTIILNAIGDCIWTGTGYDNLNYAAHYTSNTGFNFDSQWAGQELYVSIGLIVAGLAARLGYAAAGRVFPTADITAIITGTIASVFTWDYFQAKGAQWAQHLLHVSTNTASYLSSVAAGLADGPTQMLIISLITVLSKESEWSKFKKDPANYLKHKTKELGLSIFPGMIPGTVWQLVFNFGVTANLGPIATAFAVAIIVAGCSVGVAKVNAKILQSECCQTLCCETSIPILSEEDKKHEAPCVSLWNCMSGFFSTTKKETTENTTIQNDDKTSIPPTVQTM